MFFIFKLFIGSFLIAGFVSSPPKILKSRKRRSDNAEISDVAGGTEHPQNMDHSSSDCNEAMWKTTDHDYVNPLTNCVQPDDDNDKNIAPMAQGHDKDKNIAPTTDGHDKDKNIAPTTEGHDKDQNIAPMTEGHDSDKNLVPMVDVLCRLCHGVLPNKSRRSIFRDTFRMFDQLIEVLEYMPHSAGGNYVCSYCFVKLNRLSKMEKEIVTRLDSLKNDRLHLLADMRQKYTGRQGSCVSSSQPVSPKKLASGASQGG